MRQSRNAVSNWAEEHFKDSWVFALTEGSVWGFVFRTHFFREVFTRERSVYWKRNYEEHVNIHILRSFTIKIISVSSSHRLCSSEIELAAFAFFLFTYLLLSFAGDFSIVEIFFAVSI